MDDEERTINVLKRQCSYKELVDIIYEEDPNGSFTFNSMNSDREWRLAPYMNYVVLEMGWTIEDFNTEVKKDYERRYGTE